MKLKKRVFKNYNWGKLCLELLVVFLGMTAGFVLNNWQEKEKEEIVEQKYIKSFVKDVDDTIIQLTKLIEVDSIWFVQAKSTFIAFQKKSFVADSAKGVVEKIMYFNKMELRSGTYEDITNSGNLNLIKNFELKTKIVNYNLSVKGVEFIDNHFYRYFNDVAVPFVFAEYNVMTEEFKDPNIYKSMQFSNVFAGYYSYVGQRYIAYKGLLDESYLFKKDLISEIN